MVAVVVVVMCGVRLGAAWLAGVVPGWTLHRDCTHAASRLPLAAQATNSDSCAACRCAGGRGTRSTRCTWRWLRGSPRSTWTSCWRTARGGWWVGGWARLVRSGGGGGHCRRPAAAAGHRYRDSTCTPQCMRCITVHGCESAGGGEGLSCARALTECAAPPAVLLAVLLAVLPAGTARGWSLSRGSAGRRRRQRCKSTARWVGVYCPASSTKRTCGAHLHSMRKRSVSSRNTHASARGASPALSHPPQPAGDPAPFLPASPCLPAFHLSSLLACPHRRPCWRTCLWRQPPC